MRLRRNWPRTGLALLLLVLLATCRGPSGRAPSVVLVLVDDLGWKDLGCQGSEVFETPRIDGLAADGVRFARAYSNCPVCSPSRAALMTGQHPGRLGFTGHITAIGRHRYPAGGAIVPPRDRMHIPLEAATLAEALRPAGYVSASVGKWHLGAEPHWPERRGFDVNIAGHTHGSPASYFFPYRNPAQEWNPDIPNLDLGGGSEGEHLTRRLTDEALGFIERNAGRPFFLYLSHYAVHTPLQAPERLVRKYEAKLAGDPDGIDPTYAAMVEMVDHSVGRVLDKLEQLGLRRRTVVVVASDNGGLASVTDNSPLRAGKGHLYEGGIRVPLIVRWPGHGTPGSVIDAPVTNADLYPFLLSLAGIAPKGPGSGDARSVGRLIDGAEWEPRPLVWYYPHYSPQARDPGAAILADGLKLIEFYDPARVELYRLEDDPGEANDLAAEMPRRARELRARLNAWIARNVPIKHQRNPAGSGG